MTYPPSPYQQPFAAGSPGYPAHGWPPGAPYGGYEPRPLSRAAAYLAASMFLLCTAVSAVVAAMCTIMTSYPRVFEFPEMAAAGIGTAFTNGSLKDEAVYTVMGFTIGVGSTALLLAIGVFCRVGALRWMLAGLGVLTTLYYVYAVIWVLTHGGARVSAFVIIALLVWLAATVVIMLPAVGKGMRGYQPGAPGYPPPGYGYPPPGAW